MNDRATLEALLARVLAGTGPDRELDAEIDLYLLEAGLRGQRFSIPFDAPPYTASLDAAITLVPEGWTWARFHSGVFECAVLDERRVLFARGDAATPARALIAACLKARMEAQGE
jgi:hypothetical protein